MLINIIIIKVKSDFFALQSMIVPNNCFSFELKTGFIKAFSDNPVYFSKSSCKADRIMKNLFVKHLYIYPSFHVDIEAELSRHKVVIYSKFPKQ